MQPDAVTAFRDALFHARDRAWSEGAPSTHGFNIAGHSVRCHFADSAMPGLLLPALAHHAVPAREQGELDVYVWHGQGTGVDVPATPWPASEDRAWQCDTPRHFGLFLPLLNSLLWLDRELNQAIYWTPDASRVPLTEAGSPLLLLWGAWLSGRGVHLVHAAAVSGSRGASLLLGPGGSGKSSTALSCLDSPLKFLGDDYCLIRSEPEPTVFSLYSSGKIHRADRGFYPNLEATYAGENDEKILYQLVPALRHRLSLQEPITALFAVSVGDESHTGIERISAMRAVRTVAPNTVLQLRVGIHSRHTLQALSSIAQRVECFALKLGRDRKEVTHFLSEFLSG